MTPRIVCAVATSATPTDPIGPLRFATIPVVWFGSASGLPPAFSGHNNYWWWGPSPEPVGTTIAVGFDRTYLLRFFGEVRFATRLDNGLDVPNEEQGNPVWVCRAQRAPWPALWPRLMHYG